MIGTILAVLLLGVLLSVLSVVGIWRQFEGEFSIGKMIFLVWLPGTVGGLLVAKVIKGM